MLRKQKQSYCNIITSVVDIVYAQNCRAYYFVRLKKELETLKQVIKQLQTKIVKNSIFLSKAQIVFAATIETTIACNYFIINVAIKKIATTIEETKTLQTQKTR